MEEGEFYITSEEDQEEEEFPYPPPKTLEELEAKNTGWEIKLVRQEEDKIVVRISCRSTNWDWYSLTVGIPKSKFKIIGG